MLSAVEGAALVLALTADALGLMERLGEHLLQRLVIFDPAGDVPNHPAQPGAQESQAPPVALPLLGVGITPGHQRRPFADPHIGLP